MKLLLDENISSKLVKFLTKDFPESTHIDFLQMQGTTDTNIWEYAQAENYIIVSKDKRFSTKIIFIRFTTKSNLAFCWEWRYKNYKGAYSEKYLGNSEIFSRPNRRFACFRNE